MKRKKKQLRRVDKTRCNNYGVPFLVGDFKNSGYRTISKARCKLWTCPYCAEVNRSQHHNRILNGLALFEKRQITTSFVTITCHENWRGQNASITNWRRSKDKLLARYRRKYKKEYGNTCHYVYIPETHKDGSLHVHGLFTGDYGNRWWKDNARQSGLGFMAEAEKLKSVLQGANYCLKYITKHIGQEIPVKNFRRVNYSQQFPNLARSAKGGEWRVLGGDETIENAIVEGIVKEGLKVKFDGMDFDTLDDLILTD